MKKIFKMLFIVTFSFSLIMAMGVHSQAATGYSSNYMYSVQNGDSLYTIATKHGITISDILWYNSISNPDQIFVGQKIFIPAQWLIKSDKIILKSYQYFGTPYQYGALSGQTQTFDCSSFIQYIYGTQGIQLPRTSRDQSLMGTYVSSSQLRKGDLVFFYTDDRANYSGTDRIGHVAMYIGNDRLLHATVSNGVTITSFESNPYWKSHYVTSRRILN